MFAYLINVAGSHGKDQIVVGTCLQQEIFDSIKGREVVTFRSFAADVVCQIFAVNSESICLTGCIYISKDNHISQSQSIGELIPECFGTGISMRLEDTDNTTVRIIACGSQCCSNLCRMMCIIINDSDAAEFSFLFESSGSTAESLQTADDGVCINTGFCRKCDSSQCVGDIVSARNV